MSEVGTPTALSASRTVDARPGCLGTRIEVLGPLTVHAGGQRIAPIAGRQRRLLAILAIRARGRAITVDETAEALYGADAPRGARHSLATELWRLRQVLGPRCVLTGPNGYELDQRRCTVDAFEFETHLREGRTLLHQGAFSQAQQRIAQALALWRGDPVSDLHDHPFGRAEAGRLVELHLGGIEDHAATLVGVGRYQDAIDALDALTATDPAREHAWALLTESCLAAGQTRRARSAFDAARRTLDEYGVELGTELSAVGRRLDDAADPGFDRPAQVVGTVGRDAVINTVVATAAAALHRARPDVVVVSGEAGVGKSTVVASAISMLTRASGLTGPADGPLVVERVQCDPRLDLPYDTLRPLLVTLARRGTTTPGVLAQLLESGGQLDGDQPGVRSGTRVLLDAIADLVESAAAACGGLVIVIEDVHWASRQTLDALLHLLARRAAVPLFLLVTVRNPHPVAQPAAAAVVELQRRASAIVALAGLDENATGLLLGSAQPPQIVRRMHALTGGNPLFLTQLAALVTEQGAAALDAVRHSASLDDAIAEHLAGVRLDVIAVLRLAAVCGAEFDSRVLTAVAARADPPLTPIAVADGIDAAVASGLLRGVAERYCGMRFVHALICDHLYASMPTEQLRLTHVLAGEATERIVTSAEPPLDLIAYHFAHGWPVCSTADVVSRLKAAGDRAVGQLGFEQAHRYYARALDIVAMDADFRDTARTAWLLNAAAHAALASVEDPYGSEEHLRPARIAFAALHQLGVREQLPDARLRASVGDVQTYATSWMDAAALDRLERALADCVGDHDRHDSAPVSRSLIGAALAALFAYRPERARALLDRAITSDAGGSAQFLTAVWEHEAVAGKLATARRLATDPTGDPTAAWLRLWVSEVAAGVRGLTDPPPAPRAGTELGENLQWELTAWQNTTAIASGQFERAGRQIAAARAQLSSGGHSPADIAARTAALLGQRIRLTLLAGPGRLDPDQLEIPPLSWVSTHPVMVSWRAYLTAATGQHDLAQVACEELVQRLQAGAVPEGDLIPVALATAMAAVDIGHAVAIDVCRHALAEYSGQHGIFYVTAYWGSADHQLGRLATAAGDLDGAVSHFESAVLDYRRAGARPYEAQSLHQLAAVLWHRDRGSDRVQAETNFSSARALASSLGMASITAASWPPPMPLVSFAH